MPPRSIWRAPAALPAARPSCTRSYASMPSRNKVVREMERASRQSSSKMSKEQSMSHMQKLANAEYFKDGGGPLFPGTFVALPLSLYPKSPASFAVYQWSRMKHWLIGATSVLNFKLKSMPNWTTWPKWKARRGQIAPTAKALYREMLEAFAAGDQVTLNKICLGEFAKKLNAAIDRRSSKEGTRFELVKYNGALFYPKLKSHQIHQANPYDKVMTTEQAVVAVNSTQKAERYDIATGKTIPGTLKIQDKIEYVVLSRQANSKTFEMGPWRIWGTTSATSLEAYLKEKEAIDKEQVKRAGWDQMSSK